MDKVEISSYLIMASSTNHMLKGNKALNEKGIITSLVPAPVEYGSVCAIAISVGKSDIELAKTILLKNHIDIQGIYSNKPQKLLGLIERLQSQYVTETFVNIIRKIEEGKDLTKEDIVYLLKTDKILEIEALFNVADKMRKDIVGDVVDVRGAIEFSNICYKSCNYCGIRKGLPNLNRYRMSEDEIMEIVHELYRCGIQTVILQSGEDKWWTKSKIVSLLKRIKEETGLRITLSIGERSYNEYSIFKKAGANNYLLKIETTNREIFNFIHPDDNYDKRVECSKWLRELGYLNGSGCMIGLPMQKEEDIASDIIFFKDMGINMIGIGPFLPAKGTPFENYPPGSVELTLKAIAITRIVCKRVYLPATTSLASLDPDGQSKALKAGANTIMLVNTPRKYRENYQLYSNKSMIDINSAVKSIKETKREFPKYLKIDKEEVY